MRTLVSAQDPEAQSVSGISIPLSHIDSIVCKNRSIRITFCLERANLKNS
ncbi:hypothetical protein Hanom_Chr06g00500771 [Helianthus anomalus]